MAFVLESQRPVVEAAARGEPAVFRIDLARRGVGWLWARASRGAAAREGMPEFSQSVVRLMLPTDTRSVFAGAARTIIEQTWAATLCLDRAVGGCDPEEVIALLARTIEETLALWPTLMEPILAGVLAYSAANILGKSGEPEWIARVERARVDAEHIARALGPVLEGVASIRRTRD